MVCYGIIGYAIVCYGLVWNTMIWYIVCYAVVWYDMMLYDGLCQCGFEPCHCHFNSEWAKMEAENFNQYICIWDVTYTITGIHGMVPDWLFSVGFLRALRFPPTAIRQMVKWTTRLNMALMALLRVRHEEMKCYKSN